MKKLFFLTILLGMCVWLFACHSQQTLQSTGTLGSQQDLQSTEKSNMQASDNSTSSTNNTYDPENYGEYSGVDIPLTYANSMEEYLSFIENDNLIEGFVDYETISDFGDFNRFVVGGYSTADWGEYWYELRDENEVELRLKIEHRSDNEESTSNIISDVNTTDLRSINTESEGVYENSGIRYYYSIQGKLWKICWEQKGIEYILYGVENYPLESGSQTVVASLLNTQTASDTITNMFEGSVE